MLFFLILFCDRIAYLANKIKLTVVIYKIMYEVLVTANVYIVAICFREKFCEKISRVLIHYIIKYLINSLYIVCKLLV